MSFRNKRALWFMLGLIAPIILGVVGYSNYEGDRPAPIPHKETLFDGAVTYYRRVYYLPRLAIAHVLVVDTKAPGFRFMVTPPDNQDGPPLNARTTTQFMEEFGPQIAINGDGFHPWWSHGPLDYYPQPGDPVTPNGYATSIKEVYATGDDSKNSPVLYVNRRGGFSFHKPDNVFNAISGDRYLIQGGEKEVGLDDTTREPRTAIGFNKNGRWLYLVVVDGRQPFYSAGATFDELANILIAHGAYFGMALDGGGSSTMVVQGKAGQPLILNSPIDQFVPGRERAVANHIGIFIRK